MYPKSFSVTWLTLDLDFTCPQNFKPSARDVFESVLAALDA